MFEMFLSFQHQKLYIILLHLGDLPCFINNSKAVASADSTVLAYVLSELNRRHNYGLVLFLLSIDEGITGYRDDSLETVKRNEVQVSF